MSASLTQLFPGVEPAGDRLTLRDISREDASS